MPEDAKQSERFIAGRKTLKAVLGETHVVRSDAAALEESGQ